jgi:hypothetical protein
LSPFEEAAPLPCRRLEPAVAEADCRRAVVEKALPRRSGCRSGCNGDCVRVRVWVCVAGHTRGHAVAADAARKVSVDAAEAHPPMRNNGEKWPGGGIVVYTWPQRILERGSGGREAKESLVVAGASVVVIRSYHDYGQFSRRFFSRWPLGPLACPPSTNPLRQSDKPVSERPRGGKLESGGIGDHPRVSLASCQQLYETRKEAVSIALCGENVLVISIVEALLRHLREGHFANNVVFGQITFNI